MITQPAIQVEEAAKWLKKLNLAADFDLITSMTRVLSANLL